MNWIELARSAGFEEVFDLNMDSLHVLPEVREMCSADRCRRYGKSWSCPPACGSIEHCAARIKEYGSGILVQTVYPLEDEYDAQGIKLADALHKRRFSAFARQVRHYENDCLPLSAGTCTRCEVCTYPDKPCRYPGKMLSSMEAYGLLINSICEQSGIKYNHGEKTIAFTSCILLNRNKRRI